MSCGTLSIDHPPIYLFNSYAHVCYHDSFVIFVSSLTDNDDMKCRMYNCILVVGGGLSFDGTENLLQYRIWLNLPPALKQSANVLVLTKSKVNHSVKFSDSQSDSDSQ